LASNSHFPHHPGGRQAPKLAGHRCFNQWFVAPAAALMTCLWPSMAKNTAKFGRISRPLCNMPEIWAGTQNRLKIRFLSSATGKTCFLGVTGTKSF
ncbi:MAG: hypothetical protein ACTJF3_05230, partial [Glutamicibacter arilaitensis]